MISHQDPTTSCTSGSVCPNIPLCTSSLRVRRFVSVHLLEFRISPSSVSSHCCVQVPLFRLFILFVIRMGRFSVLSPPALPTIHRHYLGFSRGPSRWPRLLPPFLFRIISSPRHHSTYTSIEFRVLQFPLVHLLLSPTIRSLFVFCTWYPAYSCVFNWYWLSRTLRRFRRV